MSAEVQKWVEPLIWKQSCAIHKWGSIEEPGYGKGYAAALDIWREYLEALNALRNDRDMTVIQIAHTDIKRFDSPVPLPKLGAAVEPITFGYRDVTGMARSFAARLRSAGIGPDHKVVLWSENRAEWLSVMWGCLLEGVVLVPVDYRSSADLALRIADIVDARAIVVGETLAAPETDRPVWPIQRSSFSPEPSAFTLQPFQCGASRTLGRILLAASFGRRDHLVLHEDLDREAPAVGRPGRPPRARMRSRSCPGSSCAYDWIQRSARSRAAARLRDRAHASRVHVDVSDHRPSGFRGHHGKVRRG